MINIERIRNEFDTSMKFWLEVLNDKESEEEIVNMAYEVISELFQTIGLKLLEEDEETALKFMEILYEEATKAYKSKMGNTVERRA